MLTDLALRVRHAVYRTLAEGGVPLSATIASQLHLPVEEIRGAYQRLHHAHALVVDPHSQEVAMALPFAATPTPFKVESDARSWFANCAWDMFGIPVLMRCDARAITTCDDCGGPIVYRIEGGRLLDAHGVVHFAVSAAKWWDDIRFT
jgi:hypothetical protein